MNMEAYCPSSDVTKPFYLNRTEPAKPVDLKVPEHPLQVMGPGIGYSICHISLLLITYGLF